MALEEIRLSNRTTGGPEYDQPSEQDKELSECIRDRNTLLMETPSSSSIASQSAGITENILYMKLFHEFKQLYPKVPDDIVIQCVRQVIQVDLFLSYITSYIRILLIIYKEIWKHNIFQFIVWHGQNTLQ